METPPQQPPPQPPPKTDLQGNELSLTGDIEPIRKFSDFYREFWVECKKLWVFGAPLVVVMICQHSLGATSQGFAGQLTTLELAAISVEDTILNGLSYGIMLGMGSALETLCGQAYGAGQIDMLGIYLQRSWIILNTAGLFVTVLYVFATPILKLIGQDHKVAEAAGQFALWMIPQIFSLAFNFPVAKFLQAQGKMMAMLVITLVGFILHILFSWLFMFKLGWGLAGAAVVLNFSWWFITIVQILYVFSGACGRAWSGFSMKAFKNLWGFTKLSLASAVMICLEGWYFVLLILFAGYLKHAELSIDAISITINILAWEMFVAIGLSAAISVRVSNELGAGHPRTAKFAVVVVVIVSIALGLLFALIVIILRDKYPYMFTNSAEVRKLVYQLAPLLALSMVVNCVQPVLSGVAIGAGWQAAVAYVNIGCYYLFGIPLGLVLAYKIKLGITGIWLGMLLGTASQTCVLFIMTCRTNWKKETSKAEIRVNQWKGSPDKSNDVENMETLAKAQNDRTKANQSPTSNSESANAGGHSNSHIPVYVVAKYQLLVFSAHLCINASIVIAGRFNYKSVSPVNVAIICSIPILYRVSKSH